MKHKAKHSKFLKEAQNGIQLITAFLCKTVLGNSDFIFLMNKLSGQWPIVRLRFLQCINRQWLKYVFTNCVRVRAIYNDITCMREHEKQSQLRRMCSKINQSMFFSIQ